MKSLLGKLGVILIALGLVILWSTEFLYAERISNRESHIESFLSEGKGFWVSTHPINGKELLFLFDKTGKYCGGETATWRKSCGEYWVFSSEDGGYYLQLKEQSGKILKMTLEIKESYLIRINGRELKKHFP